jgi:hypothetical protein
MADEIRSNSVFSNLLQALRKGRRGRDVLSPKQVLTGFPPAMQPQSSVEQKQQAFLDIQYQKIAHDLYSRSVYYDTDRIGAYNDFRAMDMSPEISAALDIITDECLEANTIIPLLNGDKKTIEELYKEKAKDFWVYSYNTKEQKIEPAICKKVSFKGEQDVYKVTFDDDSYILATKEHQWLIKGEEKYLKTNELKEGTSVQPFLEPFLEENVNTEDTDAQSKWETFVKKLDYKIQKIEYFGKKETYDLVDVGIYHNFAILTPTGTGVFSHNCLTRGDKGEILSVYSSDARVKKVLKDLFFNVMNIEYNLSFWIRELLKFGDCFLLLETDRKQGIFDVRALPVAEIHREEAFDGNMNSARFRWDVNNMYFEEWQVAHFRLVNDGTKNPYGRSILDSSRKLWKQLQLAEDAMLVYRVLRAPDRRVYYIEVGNIDTPDITAYIEKVKRDLKKEPIVDSRTGQMNLKFNPATVEEDLFIPLRNGQGGRVETLAGACLALDTKIELLDGRSLELNEIIKEFEEGKELWSYSINSKDNQIIAGKIINAQVTRKNADLVKVKLSNGKEEIVTPDHKFCVWETQEHLNWNYIQAQELKEGCLLVSLTLDDDIEIEDKKVVSVEALDFKEDTGCITVEEYHNFALSSGIFISNSNMNDIEDVEYLQNKLFAALKVPKSYLNYSESMPGGSTLSQTDLRFSRTINRFQECVLIELRRVANIHLHLLGFDDDLDNFSLTLTNPSTQQELLKLETMKLRLEVFKEMFTPEVHSPTSYTWAMENIMGFSKEEIKQILRQKKIEKKMFTEIEGAVEEYLETGLFAELDEKFRKPDFVPGETPAVESSPTDFEGGSGGASPSKLSSMSAGESIAGGEEFAGGPEALETGAGAEGEAEGEAETLGERTEKVFNLLFNEEENNEKKKESDKSNKLINKNSKLNYRTKCLLESLDKKIEEIEANNKLILEQKQSKLLDDEDSNQDGSEKID